MMSQRGTYKESPTSHTPIIETTDILRLPSIFVDLTERELQLLKGIPNGQTPIDQFLLGPSFRTSHQQNVLQQMCVATCLLQDAMIASSALIACEDAQHNSVDDQIIGYSRAASAISILRSLKKIHSSDISPILMLSVSAITFALHISGSALEICRHSLQLIKPAIEASKDLAAHELSLMMCLVYSETAECLFRCEVPTMRFMIPNLACVIDRFLGIAVFALPCLYDICEISHILRQDANTNIPELMQRLDAIESATEEWEPALPKESMTRFEQAEIVSILAQAKIYRWCVLIIYYRMRHAYGQGASKATALSKLIFEKLDLTIDVSGRSMPCVNVAFIVASLELMDSEARQAALTRVKTVIQFTKKLQLKTKALLLVLWQTMDTQDQLRWFNLPALDPR